MIDPTTIRTSDTGTNTRVSSSEQVLRYLSESVGSKRDFGSKSGAASMENRGDSTPTAVRTSTVDRFLLTLLKKVKEATGCSKNVLTLVESLLWVFLCRRAFNRERLFESDKEYGRFFSSVLKLTTTVQSYESEDNREQTFIKYWLNYLLWQLTGDQTPPSREEWIDKPLFSGWLQRFVVRALAQRDASFMYSLQKGSKMMWPELGHVLRNEALADHRARVTDSQRGDCPKDLADEIMRQSKLIFNSKAADLVTKILPSTSACIQASQRQGGALGTYNPFLFPYYTKGYPCAGKEVCELSSRLGKLPSLSLHLDSWRQDTFNESCIRVRDVMLRTNGQRELLSVKVVTIPEPGKFRIITKGHGDLYTMLQPIQGHLLSCWKRHQSSTMLHQNLLDKVNDIHQRVPEPLWYSVDYKAATDLLKRHATLCCVEGMKESKFYDIMKYAFARTGVAEYPPEYGPDYYTKDGKKKNTFLSDEGKKVEMTEAQLMGHPLSFPFLCVINLACHHVAVQRWKDWKIEEYTRLCQFAENTEKLQDGWSFLSELDARCQAMLSNSLFNGDDALFKGPQDLFPFVRQVTAEAGLKLSDGKNYVSSTIAMINSQLFQLKGGADKPNTQTTMARRGYLNMKIIKGTSLKTGHSNATATQIGKDLGELVRWCPWAKFAVPAAMSRFSKYREHFRQINFTPNWYLPVHLGGYGIPIEYAPENLKITRVQRVVARQFLKNPELSLLRTKGLPLPMKTIVGAIGTWKTVNHVTSYVPDKHEELQDEWLARIALASQASLGRQEVDDTVYFNHLYDRYSRSREKISPLSCQELADNWYVRHYTSVCPSCPPLSLIDLKELPYIPFEAVDFELTDLISHLRDPIKYPLPSVQKARIQYKPRKKLKDVCTFKINGVCKNNCPKRWQHDQKEHLRKCIFEDSFLEQDEKELLVPPSYLSNIRGSRYEVDLQQLYFF